MTALRAGDRLGYRCRDVWEQTAIRVAQAEDAAEIARLAAELGYPTTTAEMASRLSALLGDVRHCVITADARGQRLRGWAHVEHRHSLEGGQRAELMGLIVDSTARNRGIGRALLEAAENWARARGLPALTVRSNIARRDSHRFYAAMGYELDKTQHVYVRRPLARRG